MEKFSTYGLDVPELLLPKEGTDLEKWPVIACDQYTQDRDYWKRCEDFAGSEPSTLKLILPEVYLNDADKSERISRIHKTMKEYIDGDVFGAPEKCFAYIERKTAYGRIRKGLIVALDLETYEWKPFSKALVRATEATIVERIPPRMEIRRGAPVESPHIMLLVNDPEKTLVEAAGARVREKKPLYATKLMEGSGELTAWAVKETDELEGVEKSLASLKKENTQTDGSSFLFAVGDGNHSLATAKAVWDEFKKNNGGVESSDGSISIPAGLENHNARFALVEIVNIYDDGLTFEPIHRILFNIDTNALTDTLVKELGGSVSTCTSADELEKKVAASRASFGLVSNKDGKPVYQLLETPITELAVSRLQPVLDAFLKAAPAQHVCVGDVCEMKKPEIDYIHGSDEVFRLGAKPAATGLLLPPIAKDSFFTTIGTGGPLPRKSFSMGEASEKRFYFECRKLFS